ncbi:MAG: DNA polymerase III, partial [Treponema sp.]|nr:DNA polymerase III [Treponema sp.]
APSMLFYGPAASGKGSSAMETARALSCENGAAPWDCACSACARHRALLHPDLAMIGSRGFAAEIAASRAAFLRDTASVPGRSLFIRSLRRLLARFAPAVWEYEAKSSRANPLPLLQLLEEELDDFERRAGGQLAEESAALEKRAETLVKNAFKLEDECISEFVPIAQVRKAAYWSRLSPSGNRKTLIIENADRMKEEARNSLLKLLEEPPESICIILTTQRRESVIPTVLSRLRPYRFHNRTAAEEREIIRRVFRAPGEAPETESGEGVASLVGKYLDSFLPQPPDKLLPLAAFFIAAVARSAAARAKSLGASGISPALGALGGHCSPIAEAAGLRRSSQAGETINALLSGSGNFEGRSFPRFLSLVLDLVSSSMKEAGSVQPACSEIWKKRLGEAQAACGVWNQSCGLALESLFYRLREDLAVRGTAA